MSLHRCFPRPQRGAHGMGRSQGTRSGCSGKGLAGSTGGLCPQHPPRVLVSASSQKGWCPPCWHCGDTLVTGGRLEHGGFLLPSRRWALLLRWPAGRRSANESDEDEGLISTGKGRGGGEEGERKEKEPFIATRLMPPPPDSHVLPHHPPARRHVRAAWRPRTNGAGERLQGTGGHCLIKSPGE